MRYRHLAQQLGQHQIGSLITTCVDFGTMCATVEFLHVSAVVGTVLGASCGAVTNFTLGRHWIFQASGASAPHQAVRYALVSATSLGLNALGEHLLHERLGIQYIIARAFVATVVSVLWNYPMQRFFVFPTKYSAS